MNFSLTLTDYAEIKNDAMRLEHLESLHAILCEMMDGSTIVPNQNELMGIYGRVSISRLL